MKKELEELVQNKLHKENINLELKSISSNRLYFFESGEDKLVLKTPNLELSALSPFWKQLRHIFGSDFITQAENSVSIEKYLSRNPYIKVPKVIGTDVKKRVFQIFQCMEGSFYEPDEFPADEELNYQLGQYIGWVHSQKFQGYGIFSDNLKLKNCYNFIEEVLRSMDKIIEEYWTSNQEVIDFYKDIKRVIPDDVGPFSLIMPDISGNQFVYSEDLKRINAVVDLDAYVIGPINFELTVLEMCLTNYSSFQKGYEQYCRLPCFKPFRSFYRFLMYLNDPYDHGDLESFLNSN